ncbi:MAG: hypothetical protein GC181_15150 [Bacteroidetes bacterium]|nr:hypothetical protein [Bacteroidota bacterium]
MIRVCEKALRLCVKNPPSPYYLNLKKQFSERLRWVKKVRFQIGDLRSGSEDYLGKQFLVYTKTLRLLALYFITQNKSVAWKLPTGSFGDLFLRLCVKNPPSPYRYQNFKSNFERLRWVKKVRFRIGDLRSGSEDYLGKQFLVYTKTLRLRVKYVYAIAVAIASGKE